MKFCPFVALFDPISLTICRYTISRVFDRLSCDPRSFYPMSFDPMSMNKIFGEHLLVLNEFQVVIKVSYFAGDPVLKGIVHL